MAATDDGATGPTPEEAKAFGQAFLGFLHWVHSSDDSHGRPNEVVALIGEFLGETGSAHSVVSRALPVFEHVNLQTALDAWVAVAGRTVDLRGIAIPPHHGTVNLQQLLT